MAAGEYYITDYDAYTPSYEAPASFISTPVFEAGARTGVAIFQIPLDRLSKVMGNTAGSGETGES